MDAIAYRSDGQAQKVKLYKGGYKCFWPGVVVSTSFAIFTTSCF